MKKLVVLCAIALMTLLLITSVARCIQKTDDVIETIYIFKAESPDDPPPPGGWTFMSTGPHPAEIQKVFDPGDKMFLGLVINEQIKNEVNFSRFTFFNKGTGTEVEVAASPSDLGPFEPGGEYLSGFQNPWEVPGENGEYELRVYQGDEVVASAHFNVGIWPASPTKGAFIEMHTKTTMAGVARHLTISDDGSIVYIEEKGLRMPTQKNPPTRTTRTGQLEEAELDRLLEMVDACSFDAEGECNARTEIIDTDAVSVLTVYYQGKTRTLTSNYQPLFHLFHTEIPELSDVPEPVMKLYRELRYIIDNKTVQVSREKIPLER